MFKNIFKKVGLALTVLCLFFASICIVGCGDPTFKIQFMVDGKVYNSVTTAGYQTIRLPRDPQKNGYDFDGWYFDEGDYLIEFTSTTYNNVAPSSDIKVYAKWNLNEYALTYEGVPDDLTNDNVLLYTVEDETITLNNPSEREGYNFLGWECDGSLISQIPRGSYGDKTLTARWEAIRYNIAYQGLVDGTNPSENPTHYTIEDEVRLQDATRVGFVFLGWSDGLSTVNEIPRGSTGTLILVAQWELENYQIEYNLEDAINSEDNPQTYSVLDGDIIFADPVRANYKFTGWFDADGNKVEGIPAGSIGNVTITAGWLPIYTITLNYGYDGQEYQTIEFSADDNDIVLESPTRVGYTFVGWYSYGTPYEVVASSTEGNIELTANWEINKYNLILTVGENIKSISYSLDNGETYTTVTTTQSVKVEYNTTWYAYAEANDGYLSSHTPENLYIGIMTGEDIEYAPSTLLVSYTITLIDEYEDTYQTSYDIETEIEAPKNIEGEGGEISFEKEGYLLYWTVTQQDGNWEIGDKISAGTTANGMYGDVTLNATYKAIDYNITYNLNDNGDATTVMPSNATTYTIESTTFALDGATRTGYDFAGWWTTDEKDAVKVESITTGTVGDIALVARWTAKKYDLVLTIAGDSHIKAIYYRVNGESAFVEVSETATIAVDFDSTWYAYAVAQNGYRTRYNASYNYISGVMTTDGASFAPTAELVEYTITLVANGLANRTLTYDVTGSVTLPSAIYVDGGNSINYARRGYDLSWTATVVAGNWAVGDVVVPQEATEAGKYYGNVTFTATYSAIRYAVSYVLDGGTNSELNPAVYTVATDTMELVSPTKQGYKFVKWTRTANADAEAVKTIGGGEIGEITLYAHWEEAFYSLTLTLNDKIVAIYYKVGDAEDFTSITRTAEESEEELIKTVVVENIRHGTSWQAYAVLDDTYAGNYELTNNESNPYVGTIETGGSTFSPQAKPYVKYSILYNLNGGTNSNNNPSEYTKLSEITFEDATREGYLFEGWVNQEGNVTKEVPLGSTGVLSLSAQWGLNVTTQEDLIKAINDATVDIINVTSDISLDSLISVSRKLTIKLGSHKLSRTVSANNNTSLQVKEDGNLTLVGDSENHGKVETVAGTPATEGATINSYGIHVAGKLNMKDVDVSATYMALYSEGETTITGADVSAQFGIYTNKGKTTANGVNIVAQIGMYAVGSAELEVNASSKIEATRYAICAFDSTTVKVFDCEIVSNNIGVWLGATSIFEATNTDIKKATLASGTHGIYSNTTGTVKLTGVKIENFGYSITVASSTSDITIGDSNLLGWSALTLNGDGGKITIVNSVLAGKNIYEFGSNNYATIVFESNVNLNKVARGYTIEVLNSTIKAEATNTARQGLVDFQGKPGMLTSGNVVTLTNCTTQTDESGYTFCFSDCGENNFIKVRESDEEEYSTKIVQDSIVTWEGQDGEKKEIGIGLENGLTARGGHVFLGDKDVVELKENVVFSGEVVPNATSGNITINVGSHKIDTTKGKIKLVGSLTFTIDTRSDDLFTTDDGYVVFVEKAVGSYIYSRKTLDEAKACENESDNVLLKAKVGNDYVYSQVSFADAYANAKDGDEIVLLNALSLESEVETALTNGTITITSSEYGIFSAGRIKINVGLTVALDKGEQADLFSGGLISASSTQVNGYYNYTASTVG